MGQAEDKRDSHYGLPKKSQLIRRGISERQQISPSTAAMTARNDAVSVAVVTLTRFQYEQ